MATVRALALLLNAAVLIIGLYLFGRANDPEELLMAAALVGSPAVNTFLIVRKSTTSGEG